MQEFQQGIDSRNCETKKSTLIVQELYLSGYSVFHWNFFHARFFVGTQGFSLEVRGFRWKSEFIVGSQKFFFSLENGVFLEVL